MNFIRCQPIVLFCVELKVIAKLVDRQRREKQNKNSLFWSTCSSWCNGSSYHSSYSVFVRAYFLHMRTMYRLLFFLFTIYHVLSARVICAMSIFVRPIRLKTNAFRHSHTHRQRNLWFWINKSTWFFLSFNESSSQPASQCLEHNCWVFIVEFHGKRVWFVVIVVCVVAVFF